MNQTHLKEPEIKTVGVPQETASSSHTDHDDDHHHGHSLNWRDINRVLFVAAAPGPSGSLAAGQVATSQLSVWYALWSAAFRFSTRHMKTSSSGA
jgi:hypothetical protein